MEGQIEPRDSTVEIALGVPTKAPVAGVAKTRLGRGLGYASAAKLHQAFLLDAVATLGRVSAELGAVRRFLMCPDERHAKILRGFVGISVTVEVQRRTGLMGCLADVFDSGFRSGAQYAAAIASDTPDLPDGHVLRCLELARDFDVVLGPDEGGGYYLIAARRPAWGRIAELLMGKDYEGATIRSATLDQATSLGLKATEGPPGYDIDTIEDFAALMQRNFPEAANSMPNTCAAVSELAGELSLAAGIDHETLRGLMADARKSE